MIHRGPPTDDPLAARLFPPLSGEVRWGLDRTQRILAALGNPLSGLPVLHVGGTNGKGSVARVWAAILRAAGIRTGLYTSPELVSFRERILIDGHSLPDGQLSALASDVRPYLLREQPSLFEAQTVLAFLAMERAGVDAAVVEVGLGGRLDATNVVTPVVTAITNVSMDHADMLGTNLVAIAREKAGIFKPGVPAFTSATDPGVRQVLIDEAAASGSPLRFVGAPRGDISTEGVRFVLPTRRWGRLELRSPLVGHHQIANIALAVRALESMPPRISITARAIRDGVARVRPAGRFQVEREGLRTWIFDVAHNPGAAHALVRSLSAVELPRPVVGVVGILADKDHGAILSILEGSLDHLLLTVPPRAHVSRRWDPKEVRRTRVAGGEPAEVHPDLEGVLRRARELTEAGGTVVVTGSSVLVGDVLRDLGWTPPEALPPSGDFG